MKKNNLIKLKLVILGLSLSVAAGPLFAMNVDEQMERLKTNSENTGSNLDQYNKNLTVSKQNVKVISKAIKDLQRLRKQIVKNKKNVKTNEKLLVRNRKKIERLRAKEQKMVAKGKVQAIEIQDLLVKLEAAQKQRQINIEAYNTRLTEINEEEKNWEDHRKKEQQLLVQIKEKEKEAKQEKKLWAGRSKDFAIEKKKWTKLNNSSKGSYRRFKTLNN